MAILPLPIARVSNLLQTSVASNSISRVQSQLLEVQNQLSTGKRLNTPSDDTGAAAIAQQIRKTLEQRQAYATNLQSASSQLGEVDSTLGDMSDLMNQAQTIASANVGSDVTSDARASAAAVVDSLFNQMMSLANKSSQGMYLFGGDRSTQAPFVQTGGGVQYVGDSTTLKNTYDDNVNLAFQVDGNDVFGALSTRVQGSTDISPSLTNATKLSDLKGNGGDGIRPGSIQISDGTNTAVVDLDGSDTLGHVLDKINASGLVTATIAPDGNSIQLAQAGANITVSEVGGGTTASDLGLLASSAGATLDGTSVKPTVTPLTPLSDLRGGAGLDPTGIRITNGQLSADISFAGATTVEDLLNKINNSGTAVRAQINAAGTGIDILNPTQGTDMTIAEIGGATAAQLGVRSFSPASQLSDLNFGAGVKTVAGTDFRLTNSLGATFDIDVDSAIPQTVQGVIDQINSTATGITASFATTGNGIVLTDTAGGAGTLTVSSLNFSQAAKDLGIEQPASGTTINGTDVNAVQAKGLFANLMKLRDSLRSNDQDGITAAAEGLKVDGERVIKNRGIAGARVQELQSRQTRLDDQNVATKALLSQLEDVDYTEAIARFSTLQTALQAGLQTTAQSLHLSLLDFLA
jgi:flagellar hook-associated protein 3 FlgL